MIEDIVALAEPAVTSQILEIGPGLGVLTGALLGAGSRVTAVEVDLRLAAHLRARYEPEIAAGTLRLVEADVLDTPLEDIASAPYDVVANLPYHITSPVLHYLLGDEPRPERFVLMVQREVAERIAAAPGGMSYLSVFVQYHATVRVAQIVPASAFEPAPEVQSAILVGETKERRLRRSRGAAVAARPGRLPRTAQDAPQRSATATAADWPRTGRCGVVRSWDRPGSAAADGQRRLTGSRCLTRLARSR